MARNQNMYPPCFGLWYGTKLECTTCRFKMLCEITVSYFKSQGYRQARPPAVQKVLPSEPIADCFGKQYGMYMRCRMCPLKFLCELMYRTAKCEGHVT